ncbi:MAG: alpha/beta fold hydrolase [Lysobacterales bacterium]
MCKYRNLLTALVITLSLCACGDSSQPESASTPPKVATPVQTVPEYSAEAFFDTVSYYMSSSSGNAFSPDGGSLLVSADLNGVFNLYSLPVAGGDPVQLTDSDDVARFGLSWFPADSRILYVFDGNGDELDHVAVREVDGRSMDLTPGTDLKASFIRFSGDGEHFYLSTTERNQRSFDVYRYSAEDYTRDLIFENPGYSIGDISPDGRWIALNKPRTSADSDMYLVDLSAEQPEPVLITEHTGNVSFSTYEFAPDSSFLSYATDQHGEFAQAWQYDLQTQAHSAQIVAEWDVRYVLHSPSGKYQVSGVNADARTEVTVKDLTSGQILTLPPLPPGDLGSIRFSAGDSHMALVVNADDSPSNVHVIDLAASSARQLTDALNPEIKQEHLVSSEVVRYSSFDGLKIPAIQYRPLNASAENPVPALVLVHGGPGGQTRTGYRAMVQHLVNHGYAVLGANNRGSSGYGKTFYHLDDKRHGEEDLQDIVYGKKYLESLDWVDGERIGIVGGSYGGYMVAAALAFEPDVFEVGIDIFGVTNWVRTLESIPPWWEDFKEALYDEMGDPATDAERHRKISPLFHADNIVKPLLVVQGANDPRVLKVESDELVAAVQKNEVPVEYLVFDDEGHGFAKRANRIAASEAYVRFLNAYLKP